MSGHSKWSKIKHVKAVSDVKKGKEFSKIARLVMQAARQGGADPSMNLRLKYALDKARQINMPKDSLERAIKKGTGDVDGMVFEEITYEGYGPGGVAILVEALTDNKNRTVGEVRKAFDRRGGNLGTTGCVSYMFETKGVIMVSASATSEDALIELALEAGAENVEEQGESFAVTTPPDDLDKVLEALGATGIEVESSGIERVPTNMIPVAGDDAGKVVTLLSELDDLDDVQNVHSNADIPDHESASA